MAASTAVPFWVATAEIVVVNVLLSADNAVVIALACRHLDGHRRALAMLFGALGTVVLLVGLTAFAGRLLALPYLRLVGAALLAWVGVALVVGDGGRTVGDDPARLAGQLGSAVRTIIVADLAMSFDNVLGVAAVAGGDVHVVAVGLGIGIPLVVFGGGLLVAAMRRLRWLPLAGGGLVGWIAGDLATRDPATAPWVDARVPTLHAVLPFVGLAVVVATGTWLLRRRDAAALGLAASEPAARAPRASPPARCEHHAD